MGIDMMAIMHGGVTDIRLPGHARLGEETDRDAGPYATKIFSVVGPFQVDRYVASATAVAYEMVDIVPFERISIPTQYILAQPWRYDRMIAAVKRRRAEEAPPPILVNRICLKGLPPMYSVVDGCHRAFAARDMGEPELVANVAREYRCDVSGFCIQGNVLMREVDGERWPVSKDEPWGLPVAPEEATVTPDYVCILQAIGIRMLPPSEQPSFVMSLAAAVSRQVTSNLD